MTIPLMLNMALIRAHALQRPFRALLSIAGVALGVLASVGIGTANIQVLRSFEQASHNDSRSRHIGNCRP